MLSSFGGSFIWLLIFQVMELTRHDDDDLVEERCTSSLGVPQKKSRKLKSETSAGSQGKKFLASGCCPLPFHFLHHFLYVFFFFHRAPCVYNSIRFSWWTSSFFVPADALRIKFEFASLYLPTPEFAADDYRDALVTKSSWSTLLGFSLCRDHKCRRLCLGY